MTTEFNEFGEIISEHEPKPGTYHSIEEIPYSPIWKEIKKRIESVEYTPEVSDIQDYLYFRENIYDPKRIFYPSCSVDISPIKAFPESDVVLLDRDPKVAEMMKKYGITQFVHSDIHDYVPKSEFDLVIIQNPQLSSRDLTKYLQNGGYVLSNNYHGNATQLLDDPNFRFVGAIHDSEKGLSLADKLTNEQYVRNYIFQRIRSEK